jgi:TonB-linked SusC/RagA family outer membrane protein
MRVNLLALMTLLTSMQLLAGPGRAQDNAEPQVTLEFHDVTLKAALNKVGRLSGFKMVFPTELVDRYSRVTLQKDTRTIQKTMGLLLEGTVLTYRIVGQSIVVFRKEDTKISGEEEIQAFGGDTLVTIRGRVLDAEGKPIAGVSITSKGTYRGAFTDPNGVFEIRKVPARGTLVLTSLGYFSQEIPVSGRTHIDLQLTTDAKAIMLADVTVVSNGYQSIPKERITGSFGVITGTELQQTPSTNIYDKLEGKVPGVYINNRRSAYTNATGTTPITIRGKTTYSSLVDNSPLVVIDGFPYYSYQSEDVLASINPDDIEQITFLKDAAAASIWGSQASNGVVVVTTKKGTHNKPPSLSFSVTQSEAGAARLKTMNQMNSAQYINLEQELVDKGLITDPASYTYSANVSQAQTAMFAYKDGLITQAQRDQQLAALGAIDNTAQIKRYLLQRAATQQYNLSLSGGGDNNTYYLSGYYYTDRPIYRANQNKGWAFTANDNHSLFNKRVTLNTELQYSGSSDKTNSSAVSAMGNGNLALHPYDNVVDSTGKPVEYAYEFVPSLLSSLQAKGYENWLYSPLEELNYSGTTTGVNNFRLNIALTGKVTSWLSLEALGNIERRFSESINNNDPNSYYARNLVNFGTSVGSSGSLVYGVPQGGILITNDVNGRSYSVRGQFDVNKSWQGIHSFSAIGGAEIREVYSRATSTTLYGYNESLGTNAAYNQTTYYTTVEGWTEQLGNSNTVSEATNRWLSYYGNGSYSLLNKYALTGSIRFDDMNMLGVDRAKRAIPLWSTGGRWDIGRERFMRKVTWVDALAARVTYGFNGSAPRSAVTVPLLTVSSTADYSTGQNWGYVYSPANPNLGWEKTRVVNYGIDYSLFQRRLSGSVEYYTKRTTGIIYNEPINATYGFSSLTFNTGNMKGHGWDIKLTGVPLRGRNWQWISTFVFSFNTNVVTDARLNNLQVSSIGSGLPYKGYPLDYMFVYRWAGLDSTGQSQVYAADGKTKVGSNTTITDFKALKYAGRTTAPYFGGFQNTFSYKQFQLGVQVNWYMGNVFLRQSISNYPNSQYFYSGFIGRQRDLALRWQKKGDELTTNVPGITGMNNNSYTRYSNSDLLATNGSYVRLQQVSLGYTVPGKWLNGKAIKGLSISATVQDLGLLWRGNKLGLDPEYQASGKNVNDNLLPSANYALRLAANF